MLHIACYDRPGGLLSMAGQLAHLCNPDSEMQTLLRGMANDHIVPPALAGMHMAIAFTFDNKDVTDPWGWAALSMWDGQLCLQQFVALEKRGRHLATALTAALFLDRGCPKTLCVFAPASARIATRLGVADVRLFKRVSDGWLRSDHGYSARRHEPQ